MAGSRIKGITIEIGGETVGLQKALTDVNKKSNQLTSELKDVEKLLKFNPGNTELVAQKQKLLADQVANTTEKLNALKDTQSKVEKEFAEGKISGEQYRAFNREIVSTQGVLDGLKGKLSGLQQEQDNIAKSTQQLNTFFEATGTSIDQFSNSLGGKLTNAIKNGTASSKQLEEAIDKIGVEALGADADLDKFKQALSKVDDGASLKSIKDDFSKVSNEALEAENKVKSFGSELKGVVGAIAVGGGIAGAVEKAFDTSKLNTKIDISFNVPEESKQSIRDAVRNIEAYGVDGEEALEGVRRQWALNKNASDEANTAIVKGASVVSQAYAGIDFIELVQEINEISGELKISNDDALGLVNSLLKVGFPPEQLDTIAEYGQQLQRAGYSAEEVQAIMKEGVDTKTWNIDNLLDGLKEGRIVMAEFGSGTDKATRQIIDAAGLSIEKFEEWGAAIAEGGDKGKNAMYEATKALDGVKDATARNELGIKMFGTKFEDQGENIINTILGAKDATVDLKDNQDQLNESITKMDANPAVQLQLAFANLKSVAEPFFTMVAEFITKILEWVNGNLELVKSFGSIGEGIAALMPQLAEQGMNIITTLIDAITQNLPIILETGVKILTNLIDGIISILPNLISTIQGLIPKINSILQENLPTILSAGGKILKSLVDGIVKLIPSLLKTALSLISNIVQTIIKNLPKIIDSGVKILTSLISGITKVLPQLITTAVSLIVKIAGELVKNLPKIIEAGVKILTSLIKGIVSMAGSLGKSIITDIIPKIVDTLKKVDLKEIGKNAIKGLIKGIGSMAGAVWDKAKSIANSIGESIKKALDIHSPSRVTEALGEYTGLGFAIGLGNTIYTIAKQASLLANAAIPNLKASSFTGTLNGTTGSNVTNNQPININLNYNGSGSINDAYTMVEIIQNQLMNKTNNRLIASGVRA
ncbi:replication protein [Heyndrickxia sp. FSL K6-6286]|uniref:replication protein n=1 Tax=Heyndrickxia sp. FSL K6-6286 TaxID=2921510 RepID=UPI00315A84E7